MRAAGAVKLQAVAVRTSEGVRVVGILDLIGIALSAIFARLSLAVLIILTILVETIDLSTGIKPLMGRPAVGTTLRYPQNGIDTTWQRA